MQIEEGKYYRNRQGDRVGPIIPNPEYALEEGAVGEKYPWFEDEMGQSFTDEGRVGFDTLIDNSYDLIEEWTQNPTNTGLAQCCREIADTLPLGSALVIRLAADRLTTVAEADGWTEWEPDGSDGPDTGDSPIDVRLRSGREWTNDGDTKEEYSWNELGSDSVTHYRLSRS